MEWEKATKESGVSKAIRLLDDGSLAQVNENGEINGLMTLGKIAIKPDLFDDWMPAGYCPKKPPIFNRPSKKRKELEERIESLEEEVKALKGWL